MTTSPTDETGTPESPGDALAALREHFRASSASIIDTFARLATQLSGNPTSPRALEVLKGELHRVTETAASYGFLDASVLAAKLEERAAAWSKDADLERETRATIIEHFASALRLAFQAPVAPDRLPPLTPTPRRRMLLVDVPQEATTDLAREATRRGYVLEVTDADRWLTGTGPDPMPHVVMLAPGSASRVPQPEHARWLPMAELEDPITNGGAAALFDRADRLLLATTWLRPTILVLDDDPSILDIARYALGKELRVVALDTPLHLFETLEREQPVVLVFEARLPSFDAIPFTRMLRGMPAYRDLPILVLGANLDSATRLAAYDAGVDDLLMKPLIPLELRARVAQRLERLRVERLTRGVHAMTAIALPGRARESMDAYGALTAAGRRATAALVRPRVSTADAAHAVAWLRESRRVVHAIGATARFASYRDDLALLLVLDAPPVLATRVLDSLQLNKPGEAPDWDIAIDAGKGPEVLLGQA